MRRLSILLIAVQAGAFYSTYFLESRMFRDSYAHANSSNLVFDLGKIPVGSSEVFAIPVRNRTGNTQRIARIVPSCSCTTVDEVPSVIDPGGFVNLPLKLHLRKSDPFFETSISIIYEGGEHMDVIFIADVIEELPKIVDFGEVLLGSKIVESITFNPIRPVDPARLRARCDLLGSMITLRSTADHVDIEIVYEPTLAGEHAGKLSVQALDGRLFETVVKGFVPRRAELFERLIAVSLPDGATEVTQSITIKAPYGDQVELLEAKGMPANGAFVRADEVIATENGVQIPLVFSFSDSGVRRGTIQLSLLAGSEKINLNCEYIIVK